MIAAAWVLMVAYSVPLFSALESIITFSGIVVLDEKLQDLIVFLYGLGVVSFLGGSQIPAVFLKRRSFVLQFGFSAAFGLILLFITWISETILKPLNVLTPVFSAHPIIALEYLAIPYIFMISIDLYLNGRLIRFSWADTTRHLMSTVTHPRRTFDEVLSHQSVLFSLVTVVVTSIVWLGRTIVVAQGDFVPVRWEVIPISMTITQDVASKAALTLPVVAAFWLLSAAFVHIIAQQLGGEGHYRDVAALLGLALVPSWMAVAVDLVEMGAQMSSHFAVSVVFIVFGFIVPLILWPLILATIAIRAAHGLSWRAAGVTGSISFLPVLMMLTLAFL